MSVQYNTEWPSGDAFSCSLEGSMCWVKPNVNHFDWAVFFISSSAADWGYECWRTCEVKWQHKVKPLGHNSSIKWEALCHFDPQTQEGKQGWGEKNKEVRLSERAALVGRDSHSSVNTYCKILFARGARKTWRELSFYKCSPKNHWFERRGWC